jgi:hypothetical protein
MPPGSIRPSPDAHALVLAVVVRAARGPLPSLYLAGMKVSTSLLARSRFAKTAVAETAVSGASRPCLLVPAAAEGT